MTGDDFSKRAAAGSSFYLILQQISLIIFKWRKMKGIRDDR